jgi:hypothetical protein
MKRLLFSTTKSWTLIGAVPVSCSTVFGRRVGEHAARR